MLLALLASFAVGTFEIGFKLFGSRTLGLMSPGSLFTFAPMAPSC